MLCALKGIDNTADNTGPIGVAQNMISGCQQR